MERIRMMLDRGMEYLITDDHEIGARSKGMRRFARMMGTDLRKMIREAGGMDPEIKTGYFTAWGFFTSPSGTWYISTGDWRSSPGSLMIRRVRDRLDYTGAVNQYIEIGKGSSQQLGEIIKC